MSLPAIHQPDRFDVVSSSLLEAEESNRERSGSAWLVSGSLAVASLEAICTFFLAASKLGILIAFTSFLSTVIVSRFHADRVRIPALALALGGAIVNLLVLWNRGRLRRQPSAAWRIKPITAGQRWRRLLLATLSVLTILLVAGEFWIHPVHFS